MGQPSIGALLNVDQDQADMTSAIAIMIVILALGIIIDALFTKADAVIRRRRGMTDPAVT
jgi:sulfonate transport system permease protein